MSIKITSEEFDKITKVQIRNITEKLKGGKPLSTSEMKQMEELKEDGVDIPEMENDYPAFTKVDKTMLGIIKRKCEISERKSYDWINKLRAQKSKSKGWDVNDILAQILERQSKAASGPNADLKREELQEKVFILRNRRMELEGELIQRQEVESTDLQIAQKLIGVIRAWSENESSTYPEHAEVFEKAYKKYMKAVEDAFNR